MNAAVAISDPPRFLLELATYADAGELRAWAARASVGAVAVYAIAPCLPKDPPAGALLVRGWADEGRAELFQVRSAGRPHCWDYCVRIVRVFARPTAALLEDGSGSGKLDQRTAAQLRRVHAHLIALAEAGTPCPSYAKLAQATRLPAGERGRMRARYLLNLLADQGKVHIARAQGGRIILPGKEAQHG